MNDYEAFLQELDQVWMECWRVLAKGGRLVNGGAGGAIGASTQDTAVQKLSVWGITERRVAPPVTQARDSARFP